MNNNIRKIFLTALAFLSLVLVVEAANFNTLYRSGLKKNSQT